MPASRVTIFKRTLNALVLLVTMSLLATAVYAETAEQAYQRGMAHQRANQTSEAILAYKAAIRLAPLHGAAHYEIGWSYWVLGEWQAVVYHWEVAQKLKGVGPDLVRYLAEARDNLAGKREPLVRVHIGRRAMTPPRGRAIVFHRAHCAFSTLQPASCAQGRQI